MNIHEEQKPDVTPKDAREFFALFKDMEFTPVTPEGMNHLVNRLELWKAKNNLMDLRLFIGHRPNDMSIVDIHPRNAVSQLIVYALIQLAKLP